MTRICFELSEEHPLKALYHPDIQMVSFYTREGDKDFSIVLNMKDYNAFLNAIQKVNVQIGEQAIKEEKSMSRKVIYPNDYEQMLKDLRLLLTPDEYAFAYSIIHKYATELEEDENAS